MVNIEPKTFDHLQGFDGLSERCMREHIKLYHGYVAKYNDLMKKLRGVREGGRIHAAAYTESFKVDITFALAAIKNHELFFDILGKDEGEPAGPLADALKQSFNSIPQYLMDLKQAALVARGWAWTAYDLDYGHLFNYEGGATAGIPVWNAVPIVAIDLAGHAYFYDFGSAKVAYIEAVMKAISWTRVAARLTAAQEMTPRRPA